MSQSQPTAPSHPVGDAGSTTARGWWHGRSGLFLAAFMAAFSTYLLVGILTMAVPDGADAPGPQFVPLIITVAGYILAVLLAVHYLRTPEPAVTPTFTAEDDATEEERRAAEAAATVQYRTFSDWYAVGWSVAGFLVFALLLNMLGWILGAALLFWCVAHGIGSRRHLFDASLGLLLSSFIYLAFDVGLGLSLPSGVLGGVF
ncbi:tripartite tricarboxylate transporter TctB family protein [Citricoccus parietis]|uniref:Tripartite tricarboxylate transporter TctB family protein n=2 Tax=Citricoccus parietis TaxID=592307 RepID=A0ABV6F0L8_9MICC